MLKFINFCAFVIGIPLISCQERCNEPYEHICKSDGKCISASYVCDGNRDCGDGSDETSNLCLERHCSQVVAHVNRNSFDIVSIGSTAESQNFRCLYGACIPLQYKCNGISNCHDLSDEAVEACKNFKCKRFQFKCDYGGCIDLPGACNAIQNCHDGSDETEEACRRHRKSCPLSRNFKCQYGACIPKSRKCDGRADCADLSDETACGAGHTFKPYRTILKPKPTLSDVAPANPEPSVIVVVDSSPGCKQSATVGPFNIIDCGTDFSACITKGNLPFHAIISATCGEDDVPTLECQLDGLWHSLNDDGRLPSTDICQKEKTNIVASITGCPSDNDASIRVLICGQIGGCDNVDYYPIGTFVLSNCGGSSPRVMECKIDTLWHPHQEILPPSYNTCTFPPGDAVGCLTEGSNFELLICGSADGRCAGGRHPRYSVILATCEKEPFILQCHSDNYWHQLGSNRGPPMLKVCQYEIPKITECGIRNGMTAGPNGFEWLWLAGLFQDNQFACTGTFISPSLIITGGHCVTRGLASLDVVLAEDLVIQHAAPGGRVIKTKAQSIRLHPKYTGGDKPTFDLALIRLRYPALRGPDIQPACIDTQGLFIGKNPMTFNRSAGDEAYSWTQFPQTLDTSCYNKGTQCSRHLDIDRYQFCGVNEESNLYLHPGSSGGPFLINLGTPGQEKWAVAGIVSHSVTTEDDITVCPKPHTIFISVNKFKDWILRCGYSDNCNA